MSTTVNTGFSWAPKTAEEIEEDLIKTIRKVIGEDVDTSPGSVLGSIVGVQAKMLEESFDFAIRWTPQLFAPPVGVQCRTSLGILSFEIQEWARIRRECAASCTGTTKRYTFDGGLYTFYRDPETAAEHGKDIEPGRDGVCWVRW